METKDIFTSCESINGDIFKASDDIGDRRLPRVLVKKNRVYWLLVLLLIFIVCFGQTRLGRQLKYVDFATEQSYMQRLRRTDNLLHSFSPKMSSVVYANAIVTLIMSDHDVPGAQALRYSAARLNTETDFIAAYIHGLVSPRALCMLEAVGWQLRPLELGQIVPKGMRHQQVPEDLLVQYAKLKFISWIEYNSLLVLDPFTLIVGDVQSLFSQNIPFGAVMDTTQFSLSYEINLSVLLIKPNSEFHKEGLQRIEKYASSVDFDSAPGRLIHLAFFERWFRLPFKYNVKLEISNHLRAMQEVWPNAVILNFQSEKPYDSGRVSLQSSRYQKLFDSWFSIFDEMSRDAVIRGDRCFGVSSHLDSRIAKNI